MKYSTLQYSAGSRKSLLFPTQWSPVSVSFLITKNKEDHMNYNVVDPTLEGLSVTDTLIYLNMGAVESGRVSRYSSEILYVRVYERIRDFNSI